MLVQKSLEGLTSTFKNTYEGIVEKAASFIKNHYNKFAKALIAGEMILITGLFSIIPVSGLTQESAGQKDYAPLVKFSTGDGQILDLSIKKAQIEPGESNAQAEKRKEEEQVAKRVQVKAYVSQERVHKDPANFKEVYLAAAQKFGIPWQLLESVHQVESGKSGSTGKSSYAGATGPMQFMPGTWRAYQIDGNGDGVADITDATDAIYTAAHYLARSGADEGRFDDAVFNYNHSRSYVQMVKSICLELGMKW